MAEEEYVEARRVKVFPAAREGYWRIVIEQYEWRRIFGAADMEYRVPVNHAIRTVPDIQQAVNFAIDVAKHEKLQLLIYTDGPRPTTTLDYHLEK
jgi:hypothetical protein